jgi:hypothetical protein
MMADVVWGHPSGHLEAALSEEWTTDDDWPEATQQTLAWLERDFNRLCVALKKAIQRGSPPDAAEPVR